MTSSNKGGASSGSWESSTLLARPKAKTPQFVRSSWDESSSSSFGPWRLVPRLDPTYGQSRHGHEAPAVAIEQDPAPQSDVSLAEAIPAPQASAEAVVEPPPPHWMGISEQELEQTRTQSYEQGVAAGLAQAREQWDGERQHEKELLRHLGIELRGLNQDTQRFFEPLRQLALHIAEQLVRAELQVNAQVVDRLITQCVQMLEQPGAKVTISLNPQDLQRVRAMGEEAIKDYQLEADDTLREGSVRARVNDTAVQDLIEHRLEALAQRLLADPGAWPGKSVLLRPASAEDVAADVDRLVKRADPRSDSRPDRTWSRANLLNPDVQDVQDIKAPPTAGESPEDA